MNMSEIHAAVASGEWDFDQFRAYMSHLSDTEAVEQYDAVMATAEACS